MFLRNATRVFDCLDIIQKYQHVGVLFYKENDEWLHYSANDLNYYTKALATSLINIGISYHDGTLEKRSKVLIMADTSPEWIIADLAIQLCGAIAVPVYTNMSDKDLIFILKQVNTEFVFVGNKTLYERITQLQKYAPSIRFIVTLKEVTNAIYWKKFINTPIHSEDRNISKLEVATIANKIKPDDIFTIIYTSGTTGLPKGVMLTHKNLMSNIKSVFKNLPEINEYKTTFTFLPLNHIYERMTNYAYIYAGTKLYYAEGLDKIVQNIKEVRPHIFTVVPRILEKIYQTILGKINEKNWIVRSLAKAAIACAKQYNLNGNSFIYRLRLYFWRRLVLDKWYKVFGGRVEFLVSGSSACSPELITVFSAARIQILEGYGLTETSPTLSVNRPNTIDKKLGTVGVPFWDCVNIKIAEDGEILCKGSIVMKGYFDDPVQTNEAIDKDGWFHTGDIGTFVEDKFLKITDRKKELFKTSNGKYVAPQPIENKIKLSPLVDQVMVWGNGQKFPVALIVPNLTNLKQFAKKANVQHLTTKQLFDAPEVRNAYKKLFQEVNEHLTAEEAIKRFKLLETEWTINGGELTPTLKLKRRNVEQKYKQELMDLYKGKIT